jgi:hypothetical protein
MRKCLLRGIAVAAMTGFVLAASAQDATTDETQYPTILQQPADQCLPVGSSATFSVVATNADSYQWYKNNAALDSQTNSTLTLASLTVDDVAYYSAAVINDSGSVPTRMADLNVYTVAAKTVTTTTKTRLLSTQSLSVNSLMAPADLGGGGVITVFGAPVMNSGGSGSCPGPFSGYVNYMRPISQGWGWAPTTNTSVLSAADLNRSDTKVQAMGKNVDIYCDQSTVNIPTPAYSAKYRFTIYFPPGTQIPTNAYAITLTGFDP